MPDLNLDTQVFDLVFSPTHDVVFAGLLTGHVKAFSYDDGGTCTPSFAVRPTKKTARSLAISPDGLNLYSVSKDRAIHTIDITTGKISHERLQTHDSAINRVTQFMSMLATGDDDGVIKFWDPRQASSVRSYTHHHDFISDFLWMEDKKHLLATSGDGTLSILDVRANKATPFAQSEDQEDELLSAVIIKDGAKIAVGTQSGIISLWNRNSGYGDCVDRVPGHPHSVDALAALTPDVLVTGSSDGLVRVVQLLPHKLLGVIADHGTFPVERLKIDRNGAWLGSASHDDVLKMTDVRDALVDSDDDDDDEGEAQGGSQDGSGVTGIEDGKGSLDEDSSDDDEEQGDDVGEVTDGDLKLRSNHGLDSNSELESEPEPDLRHQNLESQSENEDGQENPSKRALKRKKKQQSAGTHKKGKTEKDFFAEL